MKINFSNHFQALADTHGDRPAIVNVERNRRYSFSEYHKLTNQIANMIRNTFGVKKGDAFITIVENDNMSILHYPTITKGDATGCFTNYRDSLDVHTAQVSQIKPILAFIENELIGSHYAMLREQGAKVICMDPITKPREELYYFWDLVAQASDENPNIDIDDREHTFLIRFTGGTTGQGKPAAYSPDNWQMARDSMNSLPDSDWGTDTKVLHIAPLSHGSAALFLPSIYAGGCNVTMNKMDLVEYIKIIEQERITTLFLVPTILYRMLDMPETQQADLSSLTSIFYGAAPMSPGKLKQLLEKFGPIFVQIYGATEHTAFSMSLTKADHIINSPEDEKRLASVGKVTQGVEVLIMDDDGVPVTRGETGEIWMRSRSIIQGYYNQPEKTAEEFNDGWWKSGDMARMDDEGFLFIVDRKKDMIISGGFNVYASEVEAAINVHDAIFMCAVVGIPHEEWGEAVHAEVVLREGASIDESELIASLKTQLGSYKTPKSITFVDQLPISAVGKVLRKDVRQKYWKGHDRMIG